MSSKHCFESVSDDTLLGQFSALVKQDQQITADLLRHLDAIDRRELWAKLGYSSLFDLCVKHFHMSESVAGKRISVVRTARRFPVLLDMVARGEIHLSGIQRLAAHLTPDNHQQVLAAAKHQSTREIEKLVAELAPKPDVPSRLRKLPDRPPSVPPEPQAPQAARPADPQTPQAARSAEKPQSRRAPDPAPLSPRRYKLEVTLDQVAHDQLHELQDLLAHQIPNGDPAVIVKRALELLLAETKKRKIAMTEKPRAESMPRGKSTRSSRAVVAQLKREVWERDQGRCGFVGEYGHRCDATRGLEFAHLHPWGKGGEHSLDNLGLRCRAHNAYEANRDYGARFMKDKRRRRNPVHRVREPALRYDPRGGSTQPDKWSSSKVMSTQCSSWSMLQCRLTISSRRAASGRSS